MVKIIMHGCNGAMGQVITKLAAEDKDAEITAGIDRVDNRENPYPVFTSCDACDVEADVIVDFSVAQAVDGVLAYALKRKMPLVLCTTGLSEKQLEDVKTASAQIPILRSGVFFGSVLAVGFTAAPTTATHTTNASTPAAM